MSIAEPEVYPTPAPPADPGPLPKRIIETFANPAGLFERFGPGNTPWVGPALVTAAVMVVTALLIPHDAWVEMMREQLRNMPQQPGGRMPDPGSMAGFARVSMAITFMLYPFLGAVIVGGLLKLVFGAMMGGEATYQQYLGVYTHAALILALGSLVGLPIIYATHDIMRQLNLALLLGADADRKAFLFKFLMQFGIFNLWQYAVIGVGVKAVNRNRISAGAAFGGIAAIYLVMSLLGAVMQR